MAVLVRLVDKRALAGAVALLLVGVQLAALLALYFMAGGKVRAMIQTRWFWEIALNFQIFLLFLMWVCHVDRIGGAAGWRKVRAISRLVTGLAGVSLPFVTLIVATRNNWFHDKPAFDIVESYMATLFLVWLLIAYLLPMAAGLLLHRRGFIYLSLGGHSVRLQLLNVAPFALFGLVAAAQGLLGGGNLHWVLFPALVYLHGAMPYLYRAFGPRRDTVGERAPIDLF